MVVVLGVVDDHVDDLDPAVEGPARTDKEVVPVEDLQDVGFELFEQDAFLLFLLDDGKEHLASAFDQETVLGFVLDDGEDAQYELADLLEKRDLVFVNYSE